MGKVPFKLRSQGSSFKMMGSSPAKHPHNSMREAASHPKDQPHPKSEMTDSTVVDNMGNVIKETESTTIGDPKRVEYPEREQINQERQQLADLEGEVPVEEAETLEKKGFWGRLKEKLSGTSEDLAKQY